MADPYVINRVVDMNLFVLRSGQIDKRILPELDSLYESGKLKNMAIVLNGSVLRRAYGAYGYGYGYGYGYARACPRCSEWTGKSSSSHRPSS